MNYIKEAVKTEATTPDFTQHRLLHAAMGIATESMELFLSDSEENAREEAGDLFWYLALAADELGTTFDELLSLSDPHDFPHSGPPMDLLHASQDFLDYTKKLVFYGKSPDFLVVSKKLAQVLFMNILVCELLICTPVEQIQEENIAKLRARYGAKFSSSRAENRDIRAEKQAVSQV